MKRRSATINRTTKETRIKLTFELDGGGGGDICTTLPFLDHMLILFVEHGLFGCKIDAEGDTDVDDHHLVEDLGICLGEALKKALGDKKGIARYGFAQVPMDESLSSVTVDLSGRPYFDYKVNVGRKKIKKFDVSLVEEFLRAFCFSAGFSLHVRLIEGRSIHHILESVFKALGRALDMATTIDPRRKGTVPSTKGSL
jgi:imidazoleglycerol-phosphate dehydratase